MKSIMLLIGVMLCNMTLSMEVCNGKGNVSEQRILETKNEREKEIGLYDWDRAATKARLNLSDWWVSDRNYLNRYRLSENETSRTFDYWINAQALDVMIDVFEREKTSENKDWILRLYKGIAVNNNNSYINNFYDDMAWLTLACLRAYEVTGDTVYKSTVDRLWREIKIGWNDLKGGGIRWNKENRHEGSKNACINSPACIIAARLYRMFGNEDDLRWAHKIYNWEKPLMVDDATGRVWDAVGNHNPGWVFTYNQGTWIGAALEMYGITHEKVYLDDALKTMNWVVSPEYSKNGILPGGRDSDGGMFSGVCVRYMTNLILLPELDTDLRKRYVEFLQENALELRKNSPDFYFNGIWSKGPDLTDMLLSYQLSGVMLMNMMCVIEDNYPELLKK